MMASIHNQKICYFSILFQVILTVSQTMWCRCVTEILTMQGDRSAALKVFEEMCFKVDISISHAVSSKTAIDTNSTLCLKQYST